MVDARSQHINERILAGNTLPCIPLIYAILPCCLIFIHSLRN